MIVGHPLAPPPMEVIESWELGYLDGATVEQIAAWKQTGSLEALTAARDYLERLLRRETRMQLMAMRERSDSAADDAGEIWLDEHFSGRQKAQRNKPKS